MVASRTDRCRIWYRSNGITVTARDSLDVNGGLNNTLREPWTRGKRVRPRTIKAFR